MTKKNVYLQDWMSFHPYTKPDESIDYEYFRVAKKVYSKLIKFSNFKYYVKDFSLIRMACVLTAYLEDLVSHIGIWTTFSTEFMKHYGKNVPFYEENDDYIKGEINVEDIRFLVWLVIKYDEDERFLNPENTMISEIAMTIYDILSDEYLYVPENERYRQLINQKFDVYFKYRDFLTWFHYNCYLNIDNKEYVLDTIDSILEEEDKNSDVKDDLSEGRMDIIKYQYEVNSLYNDKTHFFGFTSGDWLTAIRKNNGIVDSYSEIFTETDLHQFLGEDNDYIYFRNVHNGEEHNVLRSSFKNGVKFSNGSYITISIAKCGDCWNMNGTMIYENYTDKDVENMVKLRKQGKDSCKKLYDNFIKANNNKRLKYFDSKAEYLDFLRDKMGYSWEGNTVDLPFDQPFFLFGEEEGNYLFYRCMKCIKYDGNKQYNKKIAKDDAIEFYLNIHHPYDLVCYLNDKDLLPDAYLVSSKGEEHGRKILRDNAQFIIDFCHRDCRGF